MKRSPGLFYDLLRKILNSTLLWDLISNDVFASFSVVTLIRVGHQHVAILQGLIVAFCCSSSFETLKHPSFSLCFPLWLMTYYQSFITIHPTCLYFYVTNSFAVSVYFLKLSFCEKSANIWRRIKFDTQLQYGL